MKNSSITIICICIISPSILFSQSLDTMTHAVNLGNVIASENKCNLSYDETAITNWIDDNVDASDMSFPSTLNMMITGSKHQISKLSGSAETAHCKSVMNTARHYGFIE